MSKWAQNDILRGHPMGKAISEGEREMTEVEHCLELEGRLTCE